jgi:hypothetical protein
MTLMFIWGFFILLRTVAPQELDDVEETPLVLQALAPA